MGVPATLDEMVTKTVQELAIANALAEPILEAVAGYRAKAAEAGFTPVAAEQMSVDYHAGLLRLMLR